MIQIYDNFLDKNTFEQLKQELKNCNGKYRWGHSSHGDSNISNIHPWFALHLNESFFFTNTMLEIIKDKTQKNLGLYNVYMNISNYGCTQKFHTDSEKKNDMTLVLFPHECFIENADEMEGYFYYKSYSEIKCIEPLQNRAILFDSNILHKGSNFSRHINILRESIAWKLYLKN